MATNTYSGYSKKDIINAVRTLLGAPIINIELDNTDGDPTLSEAWKFLLNQALHKVNAYVPQLTEITTPCILISQRTGYTQLPATIGNTVIKPIMIYECLPSHTAYSLEKFPELGLWEMRQISYSGDMEIDYMMMKQFETRKAMYGLNFAWKQKVGEPRTIMFDDLPVGSTNVTTAFYNPWQLNDDPLDLISKMDDRAASFLIDYLTGLAKQSIGAIRRKLSGGDRAAVMDGAALVDEGRGLCKDTSENLLKCMNSIFPIGS